MAGSSSVFTTLDPRLESAIREFGLVEPTEIQRLAFPLLSTDADALLLSPTGTGKTEAALLPILSQRLTAPTPAISTLYVTPLRALNRDLEHRIVGLVKQVGLTAAVRMGTRRRRPGSPNPASRPTSFSRRPRRSSSS